MTVAVASSMRLRNDKYHRALQVNPRRTRTLSPATCRRSTTIGTGVAPEEEEAEEEELGAWRWRLTAAATARCSCTLAAVSNKRRRRSVSARALRASSNNPGLAVKYCKGRFKIVRVGMREGVGGSSTCRPLEIPPATATTREKMKKEKA